MRVERRSQTAEATAAMRAAHQLLDAEPRVLDDPFAARMLGPELRWAVSALEPPAALRRLVDTTLRRRLPSWLRSRTPIGARRIRAQVVVRSRYAEDQLVAAIQNGVDQYVILAAGLDTFAWRRPELASSLRVFELDHPETQEWKRARARALDQPWPHHLELVPIDFERQGVEDALAASSFDSARPAFFSWLGVTYYLTADAVAATLAAVAGEAAGSAIVFDYWSSSGRQGAADRALLRAIRLSVASQGEPMLSFLEPARVASLLGDCGLELVEDLGPAAADQRYLAGRDDGLMMPRFAHLAHALRR